MNIGDIQLPKETTNADVAFELVALGRGAGDPTTDANRKPHRSNGLGSMTSWLTSRVSSHRPSSNSFILFFPFGNQDRSTKRTPYLKLGPIQ